MFKYFFLARENAPEGFGFQLFDGYHLVWLGLISCFIAIISIRYKNAANERRVLMRRILGTMILATEVWYQVVLMVTRQYNMNYLPLHLCSLAVFVCFFDAVHPSSILREFCYCLCGPGAFLALLFPNWNVLPVINFSSINSFVVHGLLIMYPVMLIYSGEFFPDHRQIPSRLGILVGVLCVIYTFNKIFDTNFMFMNYPSPGSPMVGLEAWLGNPGYVVGMFVIVLLLWIFLYIPAYIRDIYEQRRELLRT